MALSLTLRDTALDRRPCGKEATSRDALLASKLAVATKTFENALNAASAGGLIVEAHVDRVLGPAPDLVQGYVAKVEMHREAG